MESSTKYLSKALFSSKIWRLSRVYVLMWLSSCLIDASRRRAKAFGLRTKDLFVIGMSLSENQQTPLAGLHGNW